MTDLEITRFCAQAMGVDVHESTFNSGRIGLFPRTGYEYEPLHDDAECMALVKKFRLLVDGGNVLWCVHGDVFGSGVINADLNRAICESVARMQQEQQK